MKTYGIAIKEQPRPVSQLRHVTLLAAEVLLPPFVDATVLIIGDNKLPHNVHTYPYRRRKV
jgi:hypothetical protein